MEIFLFVLEIIGTIAFAIGGSILGIKYKMDILGVIIIAVIASLGGGVIRDVILNRDLIVMFDNPVYLFVAVITSIITFIFFYYLKNAQNIVEHNIFNITLNVIDGLGLGVFVVIGANNAYGVTDNLLLIIFSALITAVGGGVLRDLMVNRIPIIFRKHIYCLAALVGTLIYVLFCNIELNILGSVVTILFITIVRVISLHFKLSLPKIEL